MTDRPKANDCAQHEGHNAKGGFEHSHAHFLPEGHTDRPLRFIHPSDGGVNSKCAGSAHKPAGSEKEKRARMQRGIPAVPYGKGRPRGSEDTRKPSSSQSAPY
jgi:hypothetical protein